MARLNADATAFDFSTYLGGNGRDVQASMALDASGRIYIAGITTSTNYPTVNAFQSSLNGVWDGTLTRLSADGSTIEFSTYFGCTGNEFISDIHVDGTGAVYLVGHTSSSDFPVTSNALQTTYGGNVDSFIAKMDPDAPGTHVCGTPPPEAPTNQAPVCSNAAIADQGADANCQATISAVDVSGVTDPDGDPLTITVSPTTLVLGANPVTVTADDGKGGVSECDITVTAALISVPGDDDEDNLFAVQCSATDNCSGSLTTTAFIQAPSLTNPSVKFKVKKHKKVKYDLKKNEVKVEGPDPQGLWAAIQNAGGVPVTDGQVLKLKVTGGQKHEFKFGKAGNLKEVKGTEAPTLVCSATDAAGNESAETVSAVLPPDSDDDDDDGDKDDDGDEDKAHKFTANDLASGSLPSEFGLAQNHPNPFNPTTVISFAVPAAGEITLTIYNLRGQLVQTLHSGFVAAGQHSRVWNGKDFRGAKVASGVYVYQLKAKGFVATRKLTLTK